MAIEPVKKITVIAHKSLEDEVNGLLPQLQGSIAEAEGFIKEMKAGKK